mmetsp:Transcript_11645/g.34243  ORF Transcript_11645/g.34243 Transcript_11645/m.34243 type:complete len:116 (-) Transcript_11645:202-549(-)
MTFRPQTATSLNATSNQTTFPNITSPFGVISPRAAYRDPVNFFVMGDAPYSSIERDRFPHQVENIPSDADFAVHVGDMKGVDECSSNGPYELVSEAFLQRRNYLPPVFLTPGEWV